MCTTSAVAVLVFCLAPPAHGQTRGESRPVIDLAWRHSQAFRTSFLAWSTWTPSQDDRDVTFGIHEDYIFSRNAWVRVGYRYRVTTRGGDGREDRGVLEGTYRKEAGKVALANRSRVELRWINHEYSWRFRERLRAERSLRIRRAELVPHAMEEIFYDSKYRTIDRNRATIGAGAPLAKTARIELSYVREDATRSSPAHVNAIQIKLELTFGFRPAS